MSGRKRRGWAVLLLGTLLGFAGARGAPAQVVINEFMAVNDTTLADEDGDYSDWIELYNAGSADVDLDGWYLTDNAGNLTKWRFPHVVIESGEYRVVFASNKDRANAGGELHTDFKLGGDGEYLALVEPDGITVADAYAPTYPPQVTDISYGLAPIPTDLTLITTGETCRYFVPSDDSLSNLWTEAGFDDGGWAQGATAVGYDKTGALDPYIETDVASVMTGATLYMRMPFTVDSVSAVDALTFRARYRDGFVVYINGIEVARRNAPDIPQWNSEATADQTGTDVVSFPIANFGSALVPGTNTLAIHAMNVPGRFADFLMAPELVAGVVSTSINDTVETYLFEPSPGERNGGGSTELSPRFGDGPTRAPPVTAGAGLVVSVRVDRTLYPIDHVAAVYRAMFDAESTLTLNDDGSDGDAQAGDNVFSGALPLGGLAPGEMIRWRFEAVDDHGQTGQFPLFADPLDSPQYFGTVALDTSIVSRLPVVHWFVENPSGANNRTGTRACLWYLDQFYDNILVSLHGQSTGGFPKKSYNVDFNRGYRFLFREGEKKVKDVDFLTNWADKSKCRNTLAYGFYEDVDQPCHFAFPLRIQQNAAFFSVADMVEDGDDRFTERVGLDPDGVLYKMYNRCDSWTTGIEKKTRKDEDNSDLEALIIGLGSGNAGRHQYMYDNVDIPRAVNCLAMRAIVNDRDHGHKNYYLYRDTDGNGEWTLIPWDVDLCVGHVWTGTEHYYDDTIYTDNEIIYRRNNRFYDVIYDTPETMAMVQRRVRTLMDTFLKPEGTAPKDGYFEPRVEELLERIDPEPGESDADRDLAKWGNWGNMDTMRQACDRIINAFLPGRRANLYGRVAGGELPEGQPADARIAFGQVEFLPLSGDQHEEFVELVNTNGYAVDISGWTLSGGISFTFHGGTVIAAGQSLYVSPDVVAFRGRRISPKGEESRFVQGDYGGELSDRGETVELRNSEGTTVNSVQYGGFTNTYAGDLRVSEIMYHPADGQSEFVELFNSGGDTIDLGDVVLTGGIAFDFGRGDITSLGPGEYVVAVRNRTAFTNRYGAASDAYVAGVYTGQLNNAGDAVRAADLGDEAIIFSCDYKDARGWPLAADGAGHSLVPRVPSGQATGLLDYGGNWRASTYIGGSPGEADPELPQTVVINEIGAHTDTGLDPPYDSDDWIELYNASGTAVDIGGWYLSDQGAGLDRYQLPAGTMIEPGNTLVLTESSYFHTNRTVESGFGLNKAGDELYLSILTTNGPSRVVDAVRFKGQENGVSLGRNPDAGNYWYALSPTTNAPNAAPRKRVIISEIMYCPESETHGQDNVRDEYIELYNQTGQDVTLAETAGGWRIDGGVSYTFATNCALPAGGTLLLVSFDPATNTAALAAFKDAYGIVGFNPMILGPYDGKLSNDGERLALEKPQEPDAPTEGVSWVIVDEAIYFKFDPWPIGATGTGKPLQRVPGVGSGNDPANWIVPASPSPGVGPAKLTLTVPEYGREFLLPFETVVSAAVDASQVSGTVHTVSFYDGDTHIADDAVPPYECWFVSDTTRRSYAFTAQMTDDAGTYTAAVSQVTAVGPLTVFNLGASNTTDYSAEIRGGYSGCDYADMTLYWGEADGGTNKATWQHANSLGRIAAQEGTTNATLSVVLGGLAAGRSYCYRWQATRSGGERWSGATARFDSVPYSRWPYRMSVAFPDAPANATLTNFPVLVRLSDSIDGFSYDGFATADAADLRFSTAHGTQGLFYEIEEWDTNGTSTVWVRVPELNTGTVIRTYWGNGAMTNASVFANPEAVWSEGFEAVWHMNGDLTDSSAAQHAIENHGTTGGEGAAGPARWFAGAAYVAPDLDASWFGQHINGLTITAWSRVNVTHEGTLYGATGGSADLALHCDSGRFAAWYYEAGTRSQARTLTTARWQYLALVLDAGNARATLDDATSLSLGPYDPFQPVAAPLLGVMNRTDGMTDYFQGGIDEVRVSSVARSENWLSAEYKTVAEPDTFARYTMLPSDVDGDGMADVWEQIHLGGIGALPDGHSDADPMSDGAEYIAGTNPTNAASVFGLDMLWTNGAPAVRFAALSAKGPGYEGLERYYDLLFSSNLVNAPWIPVSGFTDILGKNQIVTYTNHVDGRILYRASVRLE